ncbi:MAG: hypothetical protein LBS74_00765 [Oscillospiraceae bacterium]|jgi:hypothetical protein|nr:hypothetical protein [Oscillospiraceae bacterium]
MSKAIRVFSVALACVLMLSLFACSKGEKKAASKEFSAIAGNWIADKAHALGHTYVDRSSDEPKIHTLTDEEMDGTKIQIGTDGSLKFESLGKSFSGTLKLYQADSNWFDLTLSGESTATGTVRLDGDKLNFDLRTDTMTYSLIAVKA